MASNQLLEDRLRTPFIDSVEQKYPAFYQHLLSHSFKHSINSSYKDWSEWFEKQLNQLSSLYQLGHDEVGFDTRLRIFRHSLLARLAIAELSDELSLRESAYVISLVAQFCLHRVYDWHYQQFVSRYGEPLSEAGEKAYLSVLLMGKLGGNELNFSSDIDLIFVYSATGNTALIEAQTRHSGVLPRIISNERFFVQLATKMTQSLGKVTEHGLLFRVDNRLRPFGQDSLLALSADAFEDYLLQQARDWERLAYAKAGCWGPNESANQRLEKILQAYVYRRYTDYGLLQSVRNLRNQIASQVQLQTVQVDNIKTSAGGIRIAEFIVQVLQLLHATKYVNFKVRGTFNALWQMQQVEFEPQRIQRLLHNLTFLRQLEHRLQMWRDQQTHQLPSINDQQQWQWLAQAMKKTNATALQQALQEVQQQVSDFFQELIPQESVQIDLALDQLHLSDADSLQHLVAAIPPSLRLDLMVELNGLLELRHWRLASNDARDRCSRLMGLCFSELRQDGGQLFTAQLQPESSWQDLFALLAAILRRSAYMSLLLEYPAIFRQVMLWSLNQPYLIRQIISLPVLLEALISPHQNSADVEPCRLKHQWKQLSRWSNSLERSMNQLREFKRTTFFKVAVLLQQQNIDTFRVSDLLSGAARVVVQAALELAIKDLTASRSYFRNPANQTQLLVVGYGKFGSFELGFDSDLDCVVLYDDLNSAEQGEQFAMRVVRKFQQILSLKTLAGDCFEVDFRLRPDGAKGVLVSGIQQFAEYQRDRSWLWEKQALIKARPMAGSVALARQFGVIRRATLLTPLAAQRITSEMLNMRAKMRQQLDQSNAQYFDLKHAPTGLVDIEFIAQYLVLRYAHHYPNLVYHRSVSKIFKQAQQNALSRLLIKDAGALVNYYLQLRNQLHQQVLQNNDKPHLLAWRSYRSSGWKLAQSKVETCWQDCFGQSLDKIS